MNRLQQLQAARAALAAEANQALDAALTAAMAEQNRALTAAEQAAQDSFSTRLAALDGLIVAEQMRLHREQAGSPVVLDAGPVGAPPAVPGQPPTRVQVGAPNVAQDPMRGFGSFGEFAQSVHRASNPMHAVVDRRLIDGGLVGFGGSGLQAAPSNFHQSSGAEGAEIPPQIRTGIWEVVFSDPLFERITMEPSSSPVVELIGDETTPWGATGVLAKWRSEGAIMDPSKLVTKTKQVRAHELYAFALVPDELLSDAPRLTDRLDRKAPEAIKWKLVEALVTGNGVGKPLGWAATNYDGKISASRAGANLIAVGDLAGMYKRLLVTSEGSDKPFWFGNRDIVGQFLGMAVGNTPVWMPPNGIQGAPGGSILGLPFFFSDHAEALGTAGDLQLINPAGYYAFAVGAAKKDISIHLYFDYAITAFRLMVRFGGTPLLSAAVTAAKGPTKSHFVLLAA